MALFFLTDWRDRGREGRMGWWVGGWIKEASLASPDGQVDSLPLSHLRGTHGHTHAPDCPILITTSLQLWVYFWGHLLLFAEKAMAPHSSILAWKIPWMEEPGRLQSKGSRRVGHDWATSLSLFTFTHWRRKWQPTLVLLPGESQGLGSLVGCQLWGCTESDTTEVT